MDKSKLIERMKELIEILNEAGKAYYQENRELMSNFEYDRLYDELLELEKKRAPAHPGPVFKHGL